VETVAPDVYIFFSGWNEVGNTANLQRAQRCDALTQEVARALSRHDDRAYNAAMDELAALVKQAMDERRAAGAQAPMAPLGGLVRR
jgi:hypothetical protein